MDVVQMQMQFLSLVRAMFTQGILDDQFKVLQSGTDESDLSFVIDVLTQFVGSSEVAVNNISNTLEQPVVDYEQVSVYAHQIKGGSSWIGARKVTDLCVELRSCCEEKKREGSLRCLQMLRHEVPVLNEKLRELIKLELEIVAAGGRIPSLE